MSPLNPAAQFSDEPVTSGGGLWGSKAPSPMDNVLAVDDALTELAKEDAAKAELVKLRFFAGLSVEEAAACLDISRATADRWWAYARAWLYERLHCE